MKVFVIGGTAFTGPPVIAQLLDRGHEVVCYHRGETNDLHHEGARELFGDRNDPPRLSRMIAEQSPDIVLDMIAYTAKEAETALSAARGKAGRLVALSSIDVYLAYGRIHRTETGPYQPTPLTESSARRETDQPEGPTRDKISVENTYLGDSDIKGTILRLPAIHGPRDRQRRFRPYLKRMDDHRPVILISRSIENWKFSRGYVENVAHAVVLAVENERAAGQVYNVAEPSAMTEARFIHKMAEVAGWKGELRVLEDERLPEHLRHAVDFGQNWDVDTTKIREQLGYREPIDITEGFRWTIEWERSNPPDEERFQLDYPAEDRILSS